MDNPSQVLFKQIVIALLCKEQLRLRKASTEEKARWRARYPEKSNQAQYEWRRKNKARWAEIQHKNWLKRAPAQAAAAKVRADEVRKRREAHRIATADARKQKAREYHQRARKLRTPEQISKERARANAWTKARVKSDPVFRMMRSFRCRLAIFITRPYKKSGMNELIGCTGEELRKHIESQFTEGMSWATYGRYGWHVDHKTPISSFNLKDPEQLKAAWHFTNLQPLWWEENLKKQRLSPSVTPRPSETVCQPNDKCDTTG